MSRKSVTSSNPIVKISRRGAQRLKSGHVWVYRSDVVAADGVGPGALVSVHDERGKPMGTALYSTASQIAVRMIARDAVSDFSAMLRQRIADAITYRERVVQNSDAYRVIFSEADGREFQIF